VRQGSWRNGNDDNRPGKLAERTAGRKRLDERHRFGCERVGPEPSRPDYARSRDQHRRKSARPHGDIIAPPEDDIQAGFCESAG
jgi:hypothetical protein